MGRKSVKDKLEWFRKARFGMFIHWGLYSVPAGVWNGSTSEGEWMHMTSDIPGNVYEKLARRFNPHKFDARKWVGVAKAAGMKYLVFTTKHHEGFCMYRTRLTSYNIVDGAPFGRDPVEELVKECRKQGIVPCLYYSVKDWHHPEYPREATHRTKLHPEGFHAFPNPDADYLKYLDYMQGQLRELLTRYGKIGIIWFDWGVMPAGEKYLQKGREIGAMMKRLQPDCLINNRFDGIKGDYGTPEQMIPGTAQKETFETCMTLNDHWSYNSHDHNWKSASTVVRNLVDIVQKGGNYLVNVGPTAQGVIPDESVKILKQVGKWLKVNGESVYGAGQRPPFSKWMEGVGAITSKPGRSYVHVFDWPEDRKLLWYDLRTTFVKAYLLADKARKPLKTDLYPRSLMLHLPEKAPDAIDSVIVIEWKEKSFP